MSRQNLTNALLTIVVFVVSLVLSLGAIEAFLRIKNSAQDVYDIEMWRYSKELKQQSNNPVLGHEHIPSSSAVLQNTLIEINSLGLRGKEIPEDSAPTRRILFLGSSITLGWGVPEKETLSARLEDMLGNGKDVQVLNSGIGNYNTVRYVERFLSRHTGLNPTDIVVQYFLNDAESLTQGGGNWFLRNSQLAVTLWTVANRYLTPSGERSLVEHYKKVYQEDAPGYRDMVGSLQRLADYAKQKNIRLFFVMTPDIHNLENYQFGFIHEQMRALASSMEYRFIDLLPDMENITPTEIWAMPGDPHPNSFGHKIMAEAIYPYLAGKK